MTKLPISAYVITLNEEKNIRRCLESLRDFEEIVVVDSFSKDATVDICREYTDKVYQHEWPGHTNQYVYAVSLTSHEWVFWIDADEVVSPELAEDIRRVFANSAPQDYDGYYVSRMTFYLGRWIRHGAWYPDYKLRLFRKSSGKYVNDDPHMSVIVEGRTARLNGKLLHYSMASFSDHLRRLDSYTDIYAHNQIKSEASFPLFSMLTRPPLRFLKSYVLKAGFLDGMPGLIVAAMSGFTVFARYVKFWERKHS
ncbi:MAG: glycosyltransferase family 2 protein [Candidatus Abyssobacteria bacterium SURF_5]|uniref:Glycosyltransferase family 2 protein n=1 Tax=Abyssobacteria bacterium (strain SURF_5) TaxID=2093360 RepID=A0A3A4P5F2_ABYX5|nr:MAG: glycosyltransferase family 2 protein [Candidatus Abyssubacteria bacterium SURF_5]